MRLYLLLCLVPLLSVYLFFSGFIWSLPLLAVAGCGFCIFAKKGRRLRAILFYCVVICMGVTAVATIVHNAREKWESQFELVASSKDVRIVSSGSWIVDWSSGGYTYSRFYKVHTMNDSASVYNWFVASANILSLHSIESNYPFRNSDRIDIELKVEPVSAWVNRVSGLELNEISVSDSKILANYVISIECDVSNGD